MYDFADYTTFNAGDYLRKEEKNELLEAFVKSLKEFLEQE